MATKKTQTVQYYQAVGRRKEAVARVRMYITAKDKTATINGKKINQGTITVNDKSVEEFFPGVMEKYRYMKPLTTTGNEDRFAISIKVVGGGKNGQLEAVIHGLARALQVLNNEEYTPKLKEFNLLTRDSRARERRKVGNGGKARRKKSSPKR